MNYLNKAFAEVIFVFAFAVGLLPRGWLIRIAGVIGDLWYFVDKRHRDVALNNLSKAYGKTSRSELKSIARTSFGNIAKILFEMCWSLRMTKKQIMRHIHVKGLDYMINAHAKGKGVLILTLHIGNWELLTHSAISDLFRISVVYRPLDFAPADRFFHQYRSRFGATPIPKKKATRRVFNALKRQECVGILLDQDSGLSAGVFADFFGYPACTNKGLAFLALKTGAPVLPVYLVRHGSMFEVHIGPEIPLIETGRKEEDIRTNTQQYNKILESIIQRYPEQWLWVHKRWKTRTPSSNTLMYR